MLYIFRYFKEIQKSIFVIKTMFEMVLFDWFMCAKVCEELSYIFPFALPVLCRYKTVKSLPCYTKAVLSVCFCLLYMLCAFQFAHVSLCGVFRVRPISDFWGWCRYWYQREQENSDIRYIRYIGGYCIYIQWLLNVVIEYLWQRYMMRAEFRTH